MTQAALVAAIRMPETIAVVRVNSFLYITAFSLERELQCKLHIARIAGALDPAEIRSIADIAIRIQELRMIEDVEKLGPELEVLAFANRKYLLH